jgi:hypothetical protein
MPVSVPGYAWCSVVADSSLRDMRCTARNQNIAGRQAGRQAAMSVSGHWLCMVQRSGELRRQLLARDALHSIKANIYQAGRQEHAGKWSPAMHGALQW